MNSSDPRYVPTSRPRSWSRLLTVGFGVALLLAVVMVQWPMLKGIAYGLVPPAQASADQLPAWRDGFDAALVEAKETGKPVLIDFTASWCPPCRVMKADVWPDPAVRDAIESHVIPVQLDVDEPASVTAAQRYGITYIPTIILVDGEGRELAREGYMNARGMTRFVNDAPMVAALAKID